MGRRPCCSKESVNRGAWSVQEDEILSRYIKTHGEGKWRDMPKRAGLRRCGKSCRLRWLNYLRPDIKRGNISPEEEDLIIRLHNLLGNRWSLIAGRLPGRTDNEIKNYWNTSLRKRVKAQPSSKTTIQEQTNSESKERRPSISGPDKEPLTYVGPHQVIRTKAVRCTKLFLPPLQEGEPMNQNDMEPGPSEIQPLISPRKDDCLNFLMDFDMSGIFASEMLESNCMMQVAGDEMNEKISDAMGGEYGHHMALSDVEFGDWRESCSFQNGAGLELEKLGLF
ncbi:hypothetical protein MRB53_001379 [Persea americana]|uniref:Uncharacterized protein n=1 Tax=Persea americana TaxID=3435 RepID=A0ACC2MRK0_PERAE|nr:hypothetical protein MRB53_001379 [Persea americana]